MPASMLPALPSGLVWQQRSFPNANFLLLLGEETTLIDSGFAAHAEATAGLVHAHSRRISRVVNTHWHSDHVGGNALFQRAGAEIVGSVTDADDLDRADPGCCVAEYLDQPVPQYLIDQRIADGDRLLLGDSEWSVLAVPGHTPGHLAFFNLEHRILTAGDTVSSYDVGWVNLMLDGPGALVAAIDSVTRLRELDPRIILPGHGPAITDPQQTLGKAVDRLQRQRANLDLAVTYGARRILAFALIIRDGMKPNDLDAYLHQQAWTRDAAGALNTTVGDFIRVLVDGMLTSGGLTLDRGVVRAATEATPVDPTVFDLPFPRSWGRLDEQTQEEPA